MDTPSAKTASVDAKFSIKPELSQSALITILLIGGFSLGAGFLFLWNEKAKSWVPICLGLVFIILAFIGWWRSQKMIDMGNSSPTRLCDGHGNQLVTDTRTLESENAVKNLGLLLQSIGSRKPLPAPDGLVDANGTPIPNTKNEAVKHVNEINSELSETTQNFVNSMCNPSNEFKQKENSLPSDAYKRVSETNNIER